ncbi:MAG: FtsX-like permease family protein [Cyclobacteriaceae bacterium]
MVKIYLKLAFRNLTKSKFTSFINIGGLAIGFLCALMILLFVQKESSFDQFYPKADRLYRVLTIDEALGVTSNLVGITLPPLAPTMASELPEVLNSVRLSYSGRNLIDYNRVPIYSERLVYVENALFDMFDFELASGNNETALKSPNTVVLTKAFSEKVFGKEDPMGKSIRLDNDQELEVVGIMKDVEGQTHMEFDVLVAMVPEQSDTSFNQFLNSWSTIAMTEYVELAPGADEMSTEASMETIIRNHDVGDNFSVTLQPITDSHLASSGILYDIFNFNKGDTGYVSTLSIVGFFVVLIAAFNFMNLSTARSANRAKEVGMRKVLGAMRGQLRVQFLLESLIVSFIALLLALGLLFVVGNYVTLDLSMNPALYLLGQSNLVVVIVVGALVIGILAGIYPAFLLSNFGILKVLKGNFKTGKTGVMLRKVLVVVQFTASVAMIIGTLVVYMQLDFMKNVDKGFAEEQVVTLNLQDESLRENAEELENALSSIPAIGATAMSNSMPGRGYGRQGIVPEGYEGEDAWIISVMSMDERYVDLMEMDLSAGRNFRPDSEADANTTVIINEAAAAAIGWDDPINKKINQGNTSRTVIGVVSDFHFANMRHKIEPLMIYFNQGQGSVFSLKINQADISSTLNQIERAWTAVNPNHPFEYQFFDEEFGQQYASDERFAELVVTFAWLAVFIACLGLFGLSTFTAEQRIKEIGIRKVMGAEVRQVVFMLSKEFTRPVILACLIAVPIAYYFLDQWLQEFAYRIDMPWMVVGFGCLLALVLSQITVSFHAIKAARANPVDVLKYE